MDAQRALLDSLMGAQRNIDMDDQERKSWKDSDVCKLFLVGFCPYELFLGTKSDMGLCKKLHEEHLRQVYAVKARTRTKTKYERRFLDFLTDVIHSLDNKIRRANERLNEKEDEAEEVQTPEDILTPAQKDRLQEIKNEIDRKNRKMEFCGNEGRVEEAQALLVDVEKLKLEEIQLQEQAKLVLRNTTYERPLQTCKICGAFVDRVDPSRTLNHESGRTHQGFLAVREMAKELEDRLKRREEAEGSSEDRERRRSRSRRSRSRRSRSSRKRKKRKNRSSSNVRTDHESDDREKERRRKRRRRGSDYD